MERGNQGTGGELTTGVGENLSRAEIKQRERDWKSNNKTIDSRGGREGQFNHGMFQVITDSNNYLQLLCTFSFHTAQLLCDYMNNSIWFEYMNWSRERRRREAKENRGKARREKVNGWCFREDQWLWSTSLLSRLISHWPPLSWVIRKFSNKSHPTNRTERVRSTCQIEYVVGLLKLKYMIHVGKVMLFVITTLFFLFPTSNWLRCLQCHIPPPVGVHCINVLAKNPNQLTADKSKADLLQNTQSCFEVLSNKLQVSSRTTEFLK